MWLEILKYLRIEVTTHYQVKFSIFCKQILRPQKLKVSIFLYQVNYLQVNKPEQHNSKLTSDFNYLRIFHPFSQASW